MLSRGISVKRRHGGAGFTLGCGCKDAKSVSVSASSPSPSGAGTSTTTETRRSRGRTNPSASTTTDTLTLTSVSSSSFVWEDAVAEFDCNNDELDQSSAAAQSFSGLLRELNELEQSVASWGRKSHRDKKLSGQLLQDRVVDKKLSAPPPRESHRKVTAKSGDLTLTTGAKGYRTGDVFEVAGLDLDGGRVEVGLDGSVAVVKQSEDPLGDFRQSMVQMIVENGIVAAEELREMLRRFLSLNAPHHHDVILRAFAEIWDAVFTASSSDDPGVPATATAPAPAHKYTRRDEPSPARPPVPRTPPRHRRSPSAWRV
ncbi:unnamed protein product [Alopecurus aequalis]